MRFATVTLALASIASTVQGFWMGDIARKAHLILCRALLECSNIRIDQGVAPYAAAGYKVFRNVKDYGAKGQSS